MLRDSRVLFVDDEPLLLAAIARKLRRDFDVVTACGADEGLKCLESDGPFVAIVADMQMPKMDGIALLKRAQETQPNAVRIMLTGNADQATVHRAIEEAHIAKFLNKPCSPETLRDAIIETVTRFKAA